MKSDLQRDEFGMEDVEGYFSESSVENANDNNVLQQQQSTRADPIAQQSKRAQPTPTRSPINQARQFEPSSTSNKTARGVPSSTTTAPRNISNGSRNPFLSYLKDTGDDNFLLSPSRKRANMSAHSNDGTESMDISKDSFRGSIATSRRSIFAQAQSPRSPHRTHINSPARRLSSSVTPRIKSRTTMGTSSIVAKMMPTSMLADSEEEVEEEEEEEEEMVVEIEDVDEEEDQVEGESRELDDSAMDIDESQEQISVIDIPATGPEVDEEEEEDEPVIERRPVKSTLSNRNQESFKHGSKFQNKQSYFSFDDDQDTEDNNEDEPVNEPSPIPEPSPSPPPVKSRQRAPPKRPEIKKAAPKPQPKSNEPSFRKVGSKAPNHPFKSPISDSAINSSPPSSPVTSPIEVNESPKRQESPPSRKHPRKSIKTLKSTTAPTKSKSAQASSKKNKPTAGRKAPVEPHVIEPHSRESSEELTNGIRRSKRIKVAPLEFWKNERIVYSLEKPEQPGIKTIVHRDSTAEKEAEAAKRQAAAKRAAAAAASARRKRRNKKAKADGSDDELNDLDEEVISEQRKEGTLVEKTYLEGSVFKYPPNEDDEGAENERELQTIAWGHEITMRNVIGGTHQVASLFDREAQFAAGGVLALKPKGTKPIKPSKQNHYFFFLTKGAVKVAISDVIFTVTKGGSFIVPRGNYYSITNILDKEARMFFVQCTDTLSNKERGIVPSGSRVNDSMRPE